MGKQAATIARHLWPGLIANCIASGFSAQEFGRRQGLTRDQSSRLSRMIREQTEATSRRTPAASLIPVNAAKELSCLTNRMIKAMMESGKRAVEQLELLNVRYDPQGRKRVKQIDSKDLPIYRFSWQTCERIIELGRRDGRDESPAISTPDGESERMRDAMSSAPPGALTVIREDGKAVENAFPDSVQVENEGKSDEKPN